MAADAARTAALRAVSNLSSRLFSDADSSFGGCGGLGFSGGASSESGGAPPPPPAPSALADSFLATLAPPQQRRSGFDVRPPEPAQLGAAVDGALTPAPGHQLGPLCGGASSSSGTMMADAMNDAMARAMQVAQALNAQAITFKPKRTLDEILQRDRDRIAAADQRNLAYVLDQKAAEKQRAKTAAAEREAAAAAQLERLERPEKRARTEAKAERSQAPTGACSIYVRGVPANASWTELEDHFGQVGAVTRVKLYKDERGNLKGDALVVFQKEASVYGATQLLNGKMLRPGIALKVEKAVFGGAEAAAGGGEGAPPLPPGAPPPPPPPPPADDEPQAEEKLRVVLVHNLCAAADAPTDAEARRTWADELTDELWLECCLHGEVERIALLPPTAAASGSDAPPALSAAVRFQSLIAAAACVDAVDGRFFGERALHAEFDEGHVAPTLPAEHDTMRQDRFGFGEMAQAYRDSLRTLTLAAAEGAPFIGCAHFVALVEHYDYRSHETHDGADVPHGAGYYRQSDAPEVDPLEQSKSILSQAADAGAPFISCAQFVCELQHYEYASGVDGVGYYRLASAPPPADPRAQSLLVLREAADAGAEFVRCEEFVGAVVGYEFQQGAEGPGYYRVDPKARFQRLLCRREAGPNVLISTRSAPRSRQLLREAAAAAADFVRCPEHVGEIAGYIFADGPDGVGYYRQPDAPPPDPFEYMSLVLTRATAAKAEFIACPNYVRDIEGYRFTDGPEGRGYYRKQDPKAEDSSGDYDELMRLAMGT